MAVPWLQMVRTRIINFTSNTINFGNAGIHLGGFAASSSGVGPTPAATTFLGDLNNDIGGSSAGTGNTILNYGGAASNPAVGIRANNQWSVNISYNTVNNNNGSGVNHPGTLRGIYAQAGTSANAPLIIIRSPFRAVQQHLQLMVLTMVSVARGCL